jgi:hypothetical protein
VGLMMFYSIQSRISNDTKNARKWRFKGLERGKGYAVMSWMIKGAAKQRSRGGKSSTPLLQVWYGSVE